MSETAVAPKATTQLFGKKERKLLTDPFNNDNPITVQVLGICSALAVTVALKPSIVMAIAVVAVTALANLTISLMRNFIPTRIRMIVQLVVIATLVTIVEQLLHAFSFDLYKQLSVYVGLIITNCIVMGRLEAFAMGNKPWQAFLDGLGNGAGYGIILIVVAFFREFLGKGQVFGYQILGDWYVGNSLMLAPPAAMFIIGIIIWIQRAKYRELIDVS
jgi:Na+-transporting NADH:ubiquinone oxidoreductase subunit D